MESSHKKVFKYLDIIEGAGEPEQRKNLKQARTFELLDNPFLKQLGDWFRELYELKISKEACKRLFVILKKTLIELNIGSDAASMNKKYDNHISIEILEPFIIMRIFKMLSEGTTNIKNQDEREVILSALLENISANTRNDTRYYINTEITNKYSSIEKSELKKIEKKLFVTEKTTNHKVYEFEIKSDKCIEDLFGDLRIPVSPTDINFFKNAGWY